MRRRDSLLSRVRAKEKRVMTQRQIKRSNLFVLRLWSEEMNHTEQDIKWKGQARRTVDGKAHDCDGLQGLLDWLTNNLEGNSTG